MHRCDLDLATTYLGFAGEKLSHWGKQMRQSILKTFHACRSYGMDKSIQLFILKSATAGGLDKKSLKS